MFWKTAAVALTLTAAGAGSAHAERLGVSWRAVAAQHADAKVVQVDGMRALELTDVAYADMVWSKVDYIFAADGGLARVRLTTTRTPYAAVVRLAERSAAEPSGLTEADAAGGADMQIRICEAADGAVTLTYEPETIVS